MSFSVKVFGINIAQYRSNAVSIYAPVSLSQGKSRLIDADEAKLGRN